MNDKRFKTVGFNNKKKQIRCVYTSGRIIILHYKQLRIHKPIRKAWIDKETKGQSIGFDFLDGTTDYMPYDQPLAIMGDPDFLLQNQI